MTSEPVDDETIVESFGDARRVTSATLRAVADALDVLAKQPMKVTGFEVNGCQVRVMCYDDQRDGRQYSVRSIAGTVIR